MRDIFPQGKFIHLSLGSKISEEVRGYTIDIILVKYYVSSALYQILQNIFQT